MKNFLRLTAQTLLAIAIAGASLSVQVAGVAALTGSTIFSVRVAYVAAFLFWLIITVYLLATKNAMIEPRAVSKDRPPGHVLPFGFFGGVLDVYVDLSLKTRTGAITTILGPWALDVLYGEGWAA